VIAIARSGASRRTIWSAIAFVSHGCPAPSSKARATASGSKRCPVAAVLRVELRHLGLGERAQRRRLGGDVERRGGPVERVVAHLTLAHEHHARRERYPAALDVPLPELRQERNHRLAHEPVGLVEQHHEGARVHCGEATQIAQEHGLRA
jgi:hypothetical protein